MHIRKGTYIHTSVRRCHAQERIRLCARPQVMRCMNRQPVRWYLPYPVCVYECLRARIRT